MKCKHCGGDVQKGKSGLFYWCPNCWQWLSKKSETIEAAEPLLALDAATVAPKCATDRLCPVHNVWHAAPPRK